MYPGWTALWMVSAGKLCLVLLYQRKDVSLLCLSPAIPSDTDSNTPCLLNHTAIRYNMFRILQRHAMQNTPQFDFFARSIIHGFKY